MAISLANISKDTATKAPRIVLLAPEKIGKSNFACGSHFENGKLIETGTNDPIVIPIKGEEGVDALDVPVFPTCNTFEEVLECISSLCSEEHEYRTVVLDSASALEPLIWDSLCREYNVSSVEKVDGGYAKGYTYAVDKWRKLSEGLDYLRTEKNMTSILIGHIKVKRFDDPQGDSYDQYQFDIHEKAVNLLFRWSDLILFANTKVAVKKEDKGFGNEKKIGIDVTGGQRFLYTQKRPAHPGGGRDPYGALPYELPLDWTSFQDAVAVAMGVKA